MPTPIEIVTRFIALWEGPGGFRSAVEAYFTPYTVWENHGLLTTTGRDEALSFFEQFAGSSGMTGMKVDMLALAAVGDKVLTERIDRGFDKDGNETIKVPVMGIFEIADGRIMAWRDYFDTASFSQE